MKPVNKIKELINKSDVATSPGADQRILAGAQKHLDKLKRNKLAPNQPNIWRIIMKSRITKLAVTALIIVAVLVGITKFGGSGTSVVWAEVARKVQASQGVIFRGRDTAMDSQEDYTMNYLSGTQSRFDIYKGDQFIRTCHDNYDTKTSVYIYHDHKKYFVRNHEEMMEMMEQKDLWRDPISMIQRFLSHEHRQLEPKTVEGVLCEGIETTDSAFLGADSLVDSFMARVWVSVETGYPVRLESEIVTNDQIRLAFVADKFQWDIELDPGEFEPKIPPDYEGVTWPGIVEP